MYEEQNKEKNENGEEDEWRRGRRTGAMEKGRI